MAEQDGWAFALLGHVQGDAVRRDVVFLQADLGPDCRRCSHSTLQQTCGRGGARHKQSAAREHDARARILLVAAHDADLVPSCVMLCRLQDREW